jgi:hypothetical protein
MNMKIKIYGNMIFVFYGSDSWSLALWEHHRLLFSENRALRKIFDSKRDEVKGEWIKVRNE